MAFSVFINALEKVYIAFSVFLCKHSVMKNVIEKFRVDSGMTYARIAALAGFSSRSVVFLHCKGMRSISPESAIKYAKALGIPLSELRPDLWPPEGESREEGDGR